MIRIHVTLLVLLAVSAALAGAEPVNQTESVDETVSVDRTGEHWSFGRLRSPPVPRAATAQRLRLRSPVDAFVQSRLAARRLALSPDADRLTAQRRVYFDLVGHPPPPELIPSCTHDKLPNASGRPDAYERLIDRLLASPHFGEKWGKYWLELAGHVSERSTGWRYRDYVIAAFNSDKPFDCFLVEQIAGDELMDWRQAEKVTPEMEELLVATGYLRCASDPTGNVMTDRPQERFALLFDTLKIFGTGVLGVTLQCSQCHDHKFDPIT